jgi:hypothetical protein
MHPLHADIARLLADRVKARSVVVWYDPRAEFVPFVDELRGAPTDSPTLNPVMLAGTRASLIQFVGSMFEIRAVVEPLINEETPERVVVYLPGCERDSTGSVLMEIEKAGDLWETQLKRLARNVLRKRYTDGVIDELLAPEGVTYADLALATSDAGSAEPPSLLKSIFHDASGSDAILAAWLAQEDRDAEVEAKEATRELIKLIRSRLGLELPDDTSLAKSRAISLRYILGGEFRTDIVGAPPASLDGVAVPRTKAGETAIREVAQRLRASFADAYAEIADRVEGELALSAASVPPDALGAIDTFRFEERVVLIHCGHLIAEGKFEEALGLVAHREQNFWLDRDVTRRAQWEGCRRLAELGKVASEILPSVRSASRSAADWVERYTAVDGWLRLDQAQRRMETFVAKLDDDPPERALAVVRRAYDEACRAMAEGFTKALAKADWTAPGAMSQTHLYREVVAEQPTPVAYFLVDAMRYEMGIELAGRLPKSAEVHVRPAVAALPSITPIGMAALQPGASASFDVVEEGGKLGARIENVFLSDLTARRKFAAARIPNLADVTLGDVLSWSKTKLQAQIGNAQVIIVRSQEIDLAGESGFAHQTRQVMDSVIDDLARALRRLADAGVVHAVLSADHGHLFSHEDRDESMRVDSPGGATVALHRRCWIGRGGTTPPGCIRVSAAELGYASDLEFVFPPGVGVFKAGGDLGYHHGGPSLQELIVPVITVRSTPTTASTMTRERLTVSNVPTQVTNRIFSVTVELDGPNLALFSTPTIVQPVLLSGNKQVGAVGMAIDGALNADAGTVSVQAGKPVTVAFLLSDDTVESVRIVVRDPTTDTELYRSPMEIAVHLGVGP